MKTAILLSGRMRTFWYNYRSIMDNLIIPNDADVFIYVGGDKQPNRTYGCSSIKTRGGDNLNCDEKTYFGEKIGKHLKRFVYSDDDPSFDIEYAELRASASPHAHKFIQDAYLRQKKCNQLRKQFESENEIKYDAIVRLRSDMHMTWALDLSTYDFSGKKLYTPSYHPPYGQADCFYFGTPEIMDIICEKFVHEFGTYKKTWANETIEPWISRIEPPTDLMDFHHFLNKYGSERIIYNANKKRFCEQPNYARTIDTDPNSWRYGSCSCCMWTGPTIHGLTIPVTYDNEIAKQHGITELKVLAI